MANKSSRRSKSRNNEFMTNADSHSLYSNKNFRIPDSNSPTSRGTNFNSPEIRKKLKHQLITKGNFASIFSVQKSKEDDPEPPQHMSRNII